MFRLLHATAWAGIALAVVACSESMPAAPVAPPAAGATAELVALSAPAPTVSCTVTTDGSTYTATVTWSDVSATSLEFLQGSTPLAQSVFSHPIRNSSLTVSLNNQPTVVQLLGYPLGTKTLCILVS